MVSGSDGQGSSVSLSADGNTLAVGGPNPDFTAEGATWIWTRSSTTWTQQGLPLVGTPVHSGSDNQGFSNTLSANGNTLAVGGPDFYGQEKVQPGYGLRLMEHGHNKVLL